MVSSQLDKFEFRPMHETGFLGRDIELAKLRDLLTGRTHSFNPILISGAAGIGKTALVNQVIASSRLTNIPFRLELEPTANPTQYIDEFLERLYADIPRNRFLVIVDGADQLSDDDIRTTTRRIFNIKAAHGLIFISRAYRYIERAEHIALENFDSAESETYLSRSLQIALDEHSLIKAIQASKGNPRALGILISALQNSGQKSFHDIITGQLYEISEGIAVPKEDIIEVVRPKIISSTDYIVQKLKKQPQHIYELSPRKFEELLAELLTDMGWDVELTKETRDGGKDMFAYLDTQLGKLLCLVEAKRYRFDRKIGVGLVRNLYGALCDHNASSAMLVTTSTFTSDAREFEKKYEYQLSLRDFGDLNQWIHAYKR